MIKLWDMKTFLPYYIRETDLTPWKLGEGVAGCFGEGCVPALIPRACPLPGGRSDKRSLLAVWAAPPMLLADLRQLSVQESGVALAM